MATYTNSTRSTSIVTSTGGVAWVDGDSVYLNQGYDDYSGGMSMPSIDLTLLHLTDGFKGNFTSALNLEATTLKIESASTILAFTSTAPGVFDEVWVRPTNAACQISWVSCTVTLAYQYSGTQLYYDSATLTTYQQHGGQQTLDEGGTAVTTGNQYGGITYLNRDIGTLNCYGGKTIVNSTSCSPTTVNVRGGEFIIDGLSGNIGTLNADSGIVDFSKLAVSITVSTRAFGPGVKYVPPRAGITVTFTTNNDYAGGPRYS